MHTSFIRVGGLLADVPDPFYEMVGAVIKTFPKLIDEHELLITKNPIWRQRTVGLGTLSPADAMAYGATGPVLRGSGIQAGRFRNFGKGACISWSGAGH